MKRFFKEENIKIFIVTAFCLAAYIIAAGFGAKSEIMPAGKKESYVKKEKRTENFSVFLECDELSQYAVFTADLEESIVFITLFSQKSDAENYGINFSRRLKYSEYAQIDTIGRIGGIVIDGKKCYNGSEDIKTPMRIYGKTAVETAKKDSENRAAVAQAFFTALLDFNMSKSDFSYIIGQCDTDISYADFCRFWESVCALSDKVTIILRC